MEKIKKGGQRDPKSLPGLRLLWKKPQNQALKNKTSLKINKIIPHFKPSRTSKLWNPNFLSRTTSRHQFKQKIKTKIKIIIRKINFLSLKNNNKFKIILNTKRELKIGHGLGVTI